jgi:hypothetical protein
VAAAAAAASIRTTPGWLVEEIAKLQGGWQAMSIII